MLKLLFGQQESIIHAESLQGLLLHHGEELSEEECNENIPFINKRRCRPEIMA